MKRSAAILSWQGTTAAQVLIILPLYSWAQKENTMRANYQNAKRGENPREVPDSPIAHKSVSVFSVFPWHFGGLFFRGNRKGVKILWVSILDFALKLPCVIPKSTLQACSEDYGKSWDFYEPLLHCLIAFYFQRSEKQMHKKKQKFNFLQNMEGKKTLLLVWSEVLLKPQH